MLDKPPRLNSMGQPIAEDWPNVDIDAIRRNLSMSYTERAEYHRSALRSMLAFRKAGERYYAQRAERGRTDSGAK